MNYQFVTGVSRSHETPVLLDGRSGALARMGAEERSDPLSEGQSDLCDAFFLSAEWSAFFDTEPKAEGQKRAERERARERATAPSCAEWSPPNGLLCNCAETIKRGGRGWMLGEALAIGERSARGWARRAQAVATSALTTM